MTEADFFRKKEIEYIFRLYDDIRKNRKDFEEIMRNNPRKNNN